MSLELHNTTQAYRYFDGLEGKMFGKINQAAQKQSGLMRASGPLVAMSSAVITLAQCVAAVGETLIKGLANLFGAPFSKKCDALKGLKQIFVGVPHKLARLAFSPIGMTVGGLMTIGGMAVNPERYSKFHEVNCNKSVESLEEISRKDFVPRTPGQKVDAFLYA